MVRGTILGTRCFWGSDGVIGGIPGVGHWPPRTEDSRDNGHQRGSIKGPKWGPKGSNPRGGSKKGSFLVPFSLRGLGGGLEGHIPYLRFGHFGPKCGTRFRGDLGFGGLPKHPKSSKNGYFGVSFLDLKISK